jgi:hypothetical protein
LGQPCPDHCFIDDGVELMKKFGIVALVAVAGLSLAACGKKAGEENAANGTDTNVAAPVNETTATANTTNDATTNVDAANGASTNMANETNATATNATDANAANATATNATDANTAEKK